MRTTLNGFCRIEKGKSLLTSSLFPSSQSYHLHMLLSISGCFHGNVRREGRVRIVSSTPQGQVVQYLHTCSHRDRTRPPNTPLTCRMSCPEATTISVSAWGSILIFSLKQTVLMAAQICLTLGLWKDRS